MVIKSDNENVYHYNNDKRHPLDGRNVLKRA